MDRPETLALIQLGIVGSHYGCTVLLPAFRAAGFQVAALAGGDRARTAERAAAAGIPHAFPDWRELVRAGELDAVAIAVPPRLQPEIAAGALAHGKAVFAEKPLAANLPGARAVQSEVRLSRRPLMIDFEFPELPAWQRAKAMLDDGAVGAMRHVSVTWMLENYATRMRLSSWKTNGAEGGGVLGNLVSHCFHYLEWFCGPLRGLSARLWGLPGESTPSESTLSLSGDFASGAGLSLAMSAAAWLGSGHRIEFYGEDGTLVLANPTGDYMRGFELLHARRDAGAMTRVPVERDDADDPAQDARIAPVSRLAARFREAIAHGTQPSPGIDEAVRVQQLIDAARHSHAEGRWIGLDPAPSGAPA
jgi:predicted dehydrogenase